VIDNTYYGSLIFNRSDDLSYAGVISGSGGVVKLGNGTLTLSGANTYTGGTAVKAGTLKIIAGVALGSVVSVGGAAQDAALEIDKGVTVPGVSLGQGGRLDNVGSVVSTISGSSAIQGYVNDSAVVVLNHDGGLIESDFSQPGYDIPAINLGPNSTLVNSLGSTIRGYTGVATAGIVNNAGSSIIGMTRDGIRGAAVVNNSNGGSILAGFNANTLLNISSGVNTGVTNASINNVGGSTIKGVYRGITLFDGGTVANDNASVISGNVAIFIGSNSNATGLVNNIGGSTITGTTAGIVLGYGGTVTNGPGSTVEATAPSSGDCSVTLACSIFVQSYRVSGPQGSLNLTNAGNIVGDVQMDPTVVNDITLIAGGYIHGALKIGANTQSTLTLDGNTSTPQLYSDAVTGTTTFGGVLVKNGAGTWIIDDSDLQDVVDTSINAGSLRATQALSGDVTVNASGNLDGVPGVAGNLSNGGNVAVHGGDTTVGGNYVQSSIGTLAVSLGSKLHVSGTATLNGSTLEVTGADGGYVSNTHTNVLTATGGLTGTFSQLVKDTGVVFTATTINYDANSVWLDTTGLNVTTAAAGNGVSYTPASFGSAQRVQGAFEQLDTKIAAGNLSGVSNDFVHAAGQFQQAPTVQAAQASLQSLSGELHAASAAMTFEAINASSRALSDRFDNLLDKGTGFGMWTHDLSVGGDMARTGFNSVGFQLNGWLVGNDRQIGRSGVAGYAFGQSRGLQRQEQSFDHNNSRSTEGMLYAGWLNGNWYTQGRVGFGHVQQDVKRQILLGDNARSVGTQYSGSYNVTYSESGLHFGNGNSHVTPFVNVEYARINRDGFTEQGAGGFGLRTDAQTVDRWQAGLGVRASRHWNLDGGRAVDFSARAQWQRTLVSHGDVFDASFVGLQQWQPLTGIGLSRYSGLFDVGMDATLSKHTTLKFSYNYEMGQRDNAQMLSARLNVAF
jgi:autotransporter-associated beta strand protein